MQPGRCARAAVYSGCVAIALLFSAACAPNDAPPTLRVNVPTPILPTPVPPSPTPFAPVSTSRPVDPEVTALLDNVDSDRLSASIATLAAFRTRNVLSGRSTAATEDVEPKGIAAARAWLVDQFKQYKAVVETQSFDYTWRIWDMTGQNVIATLPGSDPNPNLVIIGANYDSVGNDAFDGQTAAPGANTNGSGIAVMLELLRILAPLPHRSTLMFVAFDARTSGVQGSTAFLQFRLKGTVSVRGIIDLDTLGSSEGNGERDPRTLKLFSSGTADTPSRHLARQLGLFVNMYIADLTLVPQTNPARSTADDQPFGTAGLPAVRFTQGLAPGPDETGARDTPDKIEIDYLLRAARAILAGVVLIADGPPPPSRFTMQPIGDSTNTILGWAPPVLGDTAASPGGYMVALRGADSLNFDQVLSVNGATQLVWDKFRQYAFVSIASVSVKGRAGPFSAEVPISRLMGP